MNLLLNRTQRSMIDLIEACEERTRHLTDTWRAYTLRDFATVCLLTPQRSGKSLLISLAASDKDVIVFATDKARDQYIEDSPLTEGQKVVGFDNLPSLVGKHRLWVPDAFWSGLVKGPEDQNTRKIYEKIALASEGNYISIIFIDSPF